MVMRCLLPVFILLLFYNAAQAGLATVTVTPSNTKIQLGKPLILRFQAAGRDTTINPDLSALEKDFVIHDTHYTSELRPELKIRLYPRNIGIFTIPAFSINDTYTTPFKVQITQAIDAKYNRPIQVEFEINYPAIRERCIRKTPPAIFRHSDEGQSPGAIDSNWIPTSAEITRDDLTSHRHTGQTKCALLSPIPALCSIRTSCTSPGVHAYKSWVPASAGMTRDDLTSRRHAGQTTCVPVSMYSKPWIPASTGMTRNDLTSHRHAGQTKCVPVSMYNKSWIPASTEMTKELWVKQQALLKVKITNSTAVQALDIQTETIDGFKLIPLQQTASTDVKTGTTQHETGWAIFALQPGEKSLQLPAIQYIRDGVVTHRFFPPRLKFNVKPLPRYIPATFPVAKIELLSKTHTGGFYIKNKLNTLQLELTGYGITPADLPDLSYYFTPIASDDIIFYPAELDKQQQTINGITSKIIYQIPFKTTAQGFVSLPAISLNYFNPITGKLARTKTTAISFISISQSLAIVILVGLVLILFLLLRKGWRWLKAKYQLVSAYTTQTTSIKSANSHHQLHQALQHIAKAEKWPDNLTLRQLALYFDRQNKPGSHHNLPNNRAIVLLILACYSGKVSKLETTRQACLDLLMARMPVLKLMQ